MSDIEDIVMAIWFFGAVMLAGWWFNDMRRALNNLAPGKGTSDYARTNYFGVSFFLARAIKPDKLTELGRMYRERAIRLENIILAWMTSGFLLLVGLGYYFRPG